MERPVGIAPCAGRHRRSATGAGIGPWSAAAPPRGGPRTPPVRRRRAPQPQPSCGKIIATCKYMCDVCICIYIDEYNVYIFLCVYV